ncbi:MAG: hypothetical protein KAJ14_07045 [Candidatus Omnitrophica bacterium]|nr:hypothetical protein [Candidatus Omnitrophota bacterium]MCK5492848.1 hypothetical protein [Candidatus Omnitrophota bacterium]
MDVNQFLDVHKALMSSIKTYYKKHYSITVTNDDFQNIGRKIALRQTAPEYYSLFTSAVIILKLQESKKSKFNLEEKKYKTPLGPQALRYLHDAGECFTYNLATAGIMLCRLSVEMALKDRILEEKIKRGKIAETDMAIIESLREYAEKNTMLGQLIKEAKNKWNIISFDDINAIFLQVFKNIKSNLTELNGLEIVNKFTHGDVIGIQKILQENLGIEKDTKDKIVFKMVTQPGIIDNFLFYYIYEGTYEILIKLYT